MDTSTIRHDNPFHAGEQAVHEWLGIRERMAGIGQRVIRTAMPEQHQRFFEQLPFLLVGAVDTAGRPWASVLAGAPGFVQAPGAKRLHIHARPVAGDPVAGGLLPGAPVGLLGIELHTRRRNRANGRVLAPGSEGASPLAPAAGERGDAQQASLGEATPLVVEVEQSVGNCPQYIRQREARWVWASAGQPPRAVEALDALDDEALAFVRRADTLFVATQAPPLAGEAGAAGRRGADVSHRGGPAGFVRIEDRQTLLVPDYRGNFFFMTLGNLQLHPRAGVLFIDFERGDLLTLTGTTELVWDGPALDGLDGAERAWRLRIEAGWRLRDALPLRWGVQDAASNEASAPTG